MSTNPPLPSARSIATKGIIVTGIAQAWRVGISFVASIIMARLLSPTDFGVFAAAMTSLAFVNLIQDLGLNHATVQRQSISQPQMSALFWLLTGFSLALAVVVAGISPAISWFFKDDRLTGLLIACSILVVLAGVQSQHHALMGRELRFKQQAMIDMLNAAISAGVGVGVAWITLSYWALFAASLAGGLVTAIGVWTVCDWRPGRPSFEGQFKEIIDIGAGISGFNIVNYFSRNADNLLIGRYYGAEDLGLYDRAYRLLLFPLSQVLAPLGRVMFPLLSRLQSDPEGYRRAYINCVTLIMMATQPGLVFAIIFAQDLISILLGPQWVPAAPIFFWLGISGLHQVMTSTTGWLYVSQGRGGDFFKIGLYCSITTVASFLAGLPWGALGVATAYTITEYLVRLPVIWAHTGRKGPVSTRDMIVAAGPHALATLATILVLWQTSLVIRAHSILVCASLVLLSYSVYLVVVAAFPSKRTILLKFRVWLN